MADRRGAGPARAPLRVAVLSELPTPYRWPLLQRVAADPALDVTVLYYARAESDRDWGLDVRDGGERPRTEFLPGRVFHVRGRRSLYFHWNPGIRRRLAAGGFDVVVVPGWSMPTSLAAVLWCRSHATPYVLFSETNALRPRSWVKRTAKRVLLRTVVGGASAWLATGTLSRDYLVAHGADPLRVHRFANTPDVAALAAAVDAARSRRAAVRDALDTPQDAVVTVFVGRLIGAKDPATLLAAWEILERRADAPWLWIVGDGPEAKTLRERCDRSNLRRVRFAGARRPSELPEVWAAADLFVLPSVHEPWGVVVNEAMAAGLPLVLSDRVGAAADLLVSDTAPAGAGSPAAFAGEGPPNGRLVAAGDADAFASAVGAIAGDPALRARMGAASRARIAGWTYEPSVAGFLAAVRDAAGASA